MSVVLFVVVRSVDVASEGAAAEAVTMTEDSFSAILSRSRWKGCE